MISYKNLLINLSSNIFITLNLCYGFFFCPGAILEYVHSVPIFGNLSIYPYIGLVCLILGSRIRGNSLIHSIHIFYIYIVYVTNKEEIFVGHTGVVVGHTRVFEGSL